MGATYTYTISSSGGGTAVTGSGPVTSATQDVTGIDVSRLPDGTLTFSVTLTDAAGNVGAAATATATLDQTAPSGYSITADQNTFNATTATSAGFTFASAEVGTTYTYTITSDGGGTARDRQRPVTSATQDVTGIDVSGLPDGTLTFSVTLTDAAGNVGAPVAATATLDQTVPSGYSIIPDQSTLNATSAASAGFTIAGAEVGTTYTYTISSDGGGTPVTGSGTVTSATQHVTGIDVSKPARRHADLQRDADRRRRQRGAQPPPRRRSTRRPRAAIRLPPTRIRSTRPPRPRQASRLPVRRWAQPTPTRLPATAAGRPSAAAVR